MFSKCVVAACALSLTAIASADIDNDGVADDVDNCLYVQNSGQQDGDSDSLGNACDADFNQDCAVNALDLGVLRASFFSQDPVTDLNTDGVVNAEDLGVLKTLFFEAPGPTGLNMDCTPILDLTLFSDVDNPLLMGWQQHTGEFVTIVGSRDAQGTPTSVEAVLVETAGGEYGSVSLDATGRPTDVSMPDGSQLNFDWGSGDQGTISFLSADGTVATSLDIDGSDMRADFGGSQSLPRPPAANAGKESQSAEGTVRIIITSNGAQVEDANVNIVLINTATGRPWNFQTVENSEIGPGVYEAALPGLSEPITPAQWVPNCVSTVGAALTACQVGAPISQYMVVQGCALLAARVALVNPLIAPQVFAACELTFGAVRGVCGVTETLPPGFDEGFCNTIANVVEWYTAGTLTVSVEVSKNGGFAFVQFEEPGNATSVKRVIDIPPPQYSEEFSTPATGTCSTTVNLAPGNYEVLLTSAWHLANGVIDIDNNFGWIAFYSLTTSELGTVVVPPSAWFPTPEDAVASALPYSFTITEPEAITLGCGDGFTDDNLGTLGWHITGQLTL